MDCEALLDDVLATREQDAFKQLDPCYRKAALLRCWAQKEAYLKALGAGLAIAPTEVEVGFGPGKPSALKGSLGDAETGACWFVDVIAVPPDYVGAVAISGGPWPVLTTAFDTASLLANR